MKTAVVRFVVVTSSNSVSWFGWYGHSAVQQSLPAAEHLAVWLHSAIARPALAAVPAIFKGMHPSLRRARAAVAPSSQCTGSQPQNMLDGTMNLASTESLRAQEPELKPLKVCLRLFLFCSTFPQRSFVICFAFQSAWNERMTWEPAHCSPGRTDDSEAEWKRFITLDYHCHQTSSFLSGYIEMYSSAASEASFTAQVFLCPCVVQKCFSVGRANW